MSAARQTKVYIPRSPRIRGQPDRFSNHVSFATVGKTKNRVAHFTDISATGMRMIARHPTPANVGDVLTLEFSLPGHQSRIQNTARIVRKVSEFVFAVRFLGSNHEVAAAISHHLQHLRQLAWTGPMQSLTRWVMQHRRGLMISLLGTLLIGAIGAAIVFTSDEFNGRKLRSWATPYPRQWDWNYVKKFNFF